MRYVALIALLLVGCEKKLNDNLVRQFFNENLIGNSPDFALLQDGHHVATIHGYDDDQAACLSMVKTLKEDAPLSDYRCEPLNHQGGN